jgi:hypothetical protein
METFRHAQRSSALPLDRVPQSLHWLRFRERAQAILGRYALAWVLLAAALSALGVRTAAASMVQAMDLAELVEESELVAVTRVMGQQVSYDDRGRIVTDVQMQVEETQKGNVAPGASVVVRRLGGEIDGVAMRIEGEPAFENGELVLLFGKDPQHRALLRPVGMSQGAMRIFERDGERWVRSATRELALVRKSGAGKLDPEVPAVAEPRRLNDVLGEIRSLVTKAKRKEN